MHSVFGLRTQELLKRVEQEMKVDGKNFCCSPFSEVRINHDGSFNFCHYARETNMLPKENIQSQDIEDYFNRSRSIKQVRALLLQGRSDQRCEHCLLSEKISENRYRRNRNLNFGIFPESDFQQSFSESKIQGIIDSKNIWPYYYHVSLSNLCNLSCLMCHPRNSTQLGKLYKDAGLLEKDHKLLQDWTTDKTVWEKFLQHIMSNKNILCFHFMGGEPMYHKKFYEFLDACIDAKHTYFNLTFVSNGTVKFTKHFLKKLSSFKSVQIEISVENFDRSNEYIRHPSKNNIIRENIQQLNHHKANNCDVVMRGAPQLLTIFDYDKFLEWCLEQNICVENNLLMQPSFFRLCNLPDHIKKIVVQKLGKFVMEPNDKVQNSNTRNKNEIENNISQNVKQILNDMAADPVPGDLKRAVEYCAALDRSRGINAVDYLPSLIYESIFARNDYKN